MSTSIFRMLMAATNVMSLTLSVFICVLELNNAPCQIVKQSKKIKEKINLVQAKAYKACQNTTTERDEEIALKLTIEVREAAQELYDLANVVLSTDSISEVPEVQGSVESIRRALWDTGLLEGIVTNDWEEDQ